MSLEGQQFNRYRLIRLLGSGGMGDVYLAEDSRNQQHIAFKVIRSETPYGSNGAVNEVERLFRREAKAIAKLDHPHILSLYDYGEEHLNNLTLFYFVMPYCPEGSFADWLRKRRGTIQLDPHDVAHVVQQAAEALQHAHEHHVIHRDIKPSNFLVQAYEEGSMRPDLVLSDFGIARLATATSSASQSIRGTPTYMAPEQWEGNPVYATDQYGLAVMAYELLTGYSPFQGNMAHMMYQHLNTSPPLATSINPALSPQVDVVLLRALEKKPERRFPTVAEFSEAFTPAVGGALPEAILASLLPTEAQKNEQTIPQDSPVSLEPFDNKTSQPNPSSTQPGPLAGSTLRKVTATSISAEQTTKPADSLMVRSTSSKHPTLHSPQSSRPRKPNRVRTLVLIALVLIILIGSAGSIFASVHANQITATNSSATATTGARNAATGIALTNANATQTVNSATQQANGIATVQANANATALAQSNANATAAANVNATALAQSNTNATATAAANLNATALAQSNTNATVTTVANLNATALAQSNANATATSMPEASANFSCDTASDCVGPATFNNCGTDWVHLGADSYASSNGSVSCNSAIWDDHALTLYHTCNYYVLVPGDPGYSSTATLYYGFFDQNNNTMTIISLNEALAAPNQWVYLATESDVHHVNLGDDNGQTNTVIGISTMGYQCQ